jgi:hypothetical protein
LPLTVERLESSCELERLLVRAASRLKRAPLISGPDLGIQGTRG